MNTVGNPFDPLGSPSPAPAAAIPQYGATVPNLVYGAPPTAMSPPMNTPQFQQQTVQAQQYGDMYALQQQQQLAPQGSSLYHEQPQFQPTTPSPVPGAGHVPWNTDQMQTQVTSHQVQTQTPLVGQPSINQNKGYDPWNQNAASNQLLQPQTQNIVQSSQTQTAGYDPWSQNAASNQLVVSHQQSNPYAGVVVPAPSVQAPTHDYASQSLMPGSQWGLAPAPAYPAANLGGAAYNPFSSLPAGSPAQPAPAFVDDRNSLIPGFAGEAEPTVTEAPAPPPLQPPAELQVVQAQQQQLKQYEAPASPPRQEVSERPDPGSRAIVPVPEVRNPYSPELARRAPPGASPLPKAELVRKTGYVLSRISFRTIVMKKWKQSFWVQYGSHTMLWFRSQGDFDDWLNNPYHTQAQRNFLIKLAVNFVHDLYKPNVRGYQVTQCRVKPYGTKMVRQFKLERWMDYGPTIAAAFGSYDPKEVDALREAIVECMRNTPLDGGIRATGAIKEYHERQRQAEEEGNGNEQRGQQYENGTSNSHIAGSKAPGSSYNPNINSTGGNDFRQRANSTGNDFRPRDPAPSRSVVSATDLLDDHNAFDDNASLPAAAIVPSYNKTAAPYPGAPSQQTYQQPQYQQSVQSHYQPPAHQHPELQYQQPLQQQYQPPELQYQQSPQQQQQYGYQQQYGNPYPQQAVQQPF